MNPESFMISEICQTQKGKYCIIPLIQVTRIGKFMEGSTMEVTTGWGDKEGTGSHCVLGTECWDGEKNSRNGQW